ncbi:hypothetical protein IM697_22755 [Streptomyces ferrugineus]|uniref:HsdR n=1 Tax=Streptomyces ferrugineus TaxID=1413221 RepID=A0A7M2S9X3_9ACTN|nr:hypothetical protein [Streptomyces ferrugineus]QOV33094.1 hypothetical protein IM697_22755 [Streptomyces ferrugineus]
MHYPLITNGLDYLIDVADRLTADPAGLPDARALKYAVLHLQAATEVLLKARLQDEHWTLVFKKPETATRTAFDNADFESCTTDEAFTRLTQITGLDLPDKALAAVKKLARDRNALQHYAFTAPAGAVEARAADVLNFLLPFIADHLLPRLDTEQRDDADLMLAAVRGKLARIEAYLKKRRNELRTELKDVANRTVTCPECEQMTLVLGGDLPKCRFCLKAWDSTLTVADEYTFQLYGMPGHDERDLWVCPACEAEALVTAVTADAPDTPRKLCFSCATDFAGTALTLCGGGCGRCVPADSEELLCPDCATLAFDQNLTMSETDPQPNTRGLEPDEPSEHGWPRPEPSTPPANSPTRT